MKKENPNICGTGGQRVNGHAHRMAPGLSIWPQPPDHGDITVAGSERDPAIMLIPDVRQTWLSGKTTDYHTGDVPTTFTRD